ncbi:hypothetical protein [Marinifilum sp.]|uniref:hypothetical protein n=1 Tax=Marinifilum sp. TaxID=2033137 RepID=UPI003BAD0C99
MIDGIIIELIDFDSNLWKFNPKLSFDYTINEDTREIKGSKVSIYNGLRFIIEPKGKVKIKGSIHKFYNKGEHNGDRFTYDDFQKAVNQLSEFGVNPETAILRGFEIGLNLDTSLCKIDTKTFLDSILYCRGAERSDMEINGKTGYGYSYKRTNTTYKFYDKAEQACLQSEMLRIETKFTKMRSVESYQIHTLSDLLDKEKFVRLIKDKFLKFIDETIFFEWRQLPTTHKIPKKYKGKFKDLRNPNWWLKDERSRIDRQRYKELLEKLVNKYAKRNIKNILKDLISLEISNIARTKNCYEYTEFQVLNGWNKLKKHAQKSVTNTPCIVWCESTEQGEVKKEKNYCLVCDKEIKGNKKSKYCTDQRKCRDKAYNLKVSEQRKAKRTQKQEQIVKLINEVGENLKLIKTNNPDRKKRIGIPSRKTSIIVKMNGRERLYNGDDARFFLKEFDKRTKKEKLTKCPVNRLKKA